MQTEEPTRFTGALRTAELLRGLAVVTFLAALVLFVLGLRSDDPESVQDVTYFAIAGASVVSAVTLAALGHGLEVLVSIYEVIRRRD